MHFSGIQRLNVGQALEQIKTIMTQSKTIKTINNDVPNKKQR